MVVDWEDKRWFRTPYRSLLVPAFITVISLAFRCFWFKDDTGASGNVYTDEAYVYGMVYMRMGPYACGMAVAYVHLLWKQVGVPTALQPRSADAPLLNRTQLAHRGLSLGLGASWLVLTWYGAIIYPGMTANGQTLYVGGLLKLHDPSVSALTFLGVFARTLFGLCVAYFILMMLNDHAWLLRKILSWPVWIPFARLSYSACECIPSSACVERPRDHHALRRKFLPTPHPRTRAQICCNSRAITG